MNTEPNPEEDDAARLTAWAVQELPYRENAAFEAACASDRVRLQEAEETRAFCQLLDSHLAEPAPDPLGDAQREALTAELQRVVRKKMRPRPWVIQWLAGIPAAGWAALLFLGMIAMAGSYAGYGRIMSGPSEAAAIQAVYERSLYTLPPAAGESFAGLPENPFLTVREQPLSTFGVDVDTASYSIVRRYLHDGERPPVEAVRLEELVNYFPTHDAPPADGRPFAAHVECTSAPWAAGHRLVRIALKGKTVSAETRGPANLVFLVDTSGSMQDADKLPLVQQSLRLLLGGLEPADRVTLVTYAGDSRVVLPSTPVADRQAIVSAIDSLSAGGSTNGAGGIRVAYEAARARYISGGVNRVILATDGDFNVGVTDHQELEELIAREAKSGVYLSVLTFGSGNLKDDTAELLADWGNGNYAYIDSLSEARKALVEQLSGTLVTIAKDVKIQVEFNPARVQSYRLLGYENRALEARDFNDDRKDAGEIGAGHSVTALYEIVPPGMPSPAAGTDPLKYQAAPAAPAPENVLTPAASTGELLTVKLRYQLPSGSAPGGKIEVPVQDGGATLAESSEDFRWSVAVAGYGLLLKDSAWAGTLTWGTVRELARGAKGDDPDGSRGEFLQLLGTAESLVPARR